MGSVDGPESEDHGSAAEDEVEGSSSDDYVRPKIRISAADSCPWCGEPGIPVLFGYPTEDGFEAGQAGRVILAGCVLFGDDSDPQWQCRRDSSHVWTSGDPRNPLWLEALTQALALNGRHGQDPDQPPF